MITKRPKVSIIIPNYNGGQVLLDCLDCLKKQDYPVSEVIVVDNASTDNSVKLVKKKFPRTKIFKLQKNEGFAKAVNLGIKKAQGNSYLLLNNDILLKFQTLKKLLSALEQKKDYGLSGGKILDTSGKVNIKGVKLNPYLCFQIYGTLPQTQQEVDWVSGACLLIQKEVFDKIGLFDEKFFFYFEDTDFCLRAHKAGFKIIYQPEAEMIHLGGISSQKVTKSTLNLNWYRGKFRCLFKHGTLLQVLVSLTTQVLVFPYKVWLKKDGTGMAQLKGFFYSLKNR
ncbi:MAG: glycosyltransferase family 2 protein [bacterium]|nr:glycosyltransferase family 2 protein [bacterium]